jgi:hypothetical protein
LRAAIIGHFHNMMVTTETLVLCLPHFYSALVGPSQVVRSSAAKALGEMSRKTLEDMPDLVFEAFSALLNDPYAWCGVAGAVHRGCPGLSSLDRSAHYTVLQSNLDVDSEPAHIVGGKSRAPRFPFRRQTQKPRFAGFCFRPHKKLALAHASTGGR